MNKSRKIQLDFNPSGSKFLSEIVKLLSLKIYQFKIPNRNAIKKCETSSKLTIKTALFPFSRFHTFFKCFLVAFEPVCLPGYIVFRKVVLIVTAAHLELTSFW